MKTHSLNHRICRSIPPDSPRLSHLINILFIRMSAAVHIAMKQSYATSSPTLILFTSFTRSCRHFYTFSIYSIYLFMLPYFFAYIFFSFQLLMPSLSLNTLNYDNGYIALNIKNCVIYILMFMCLWIDVCVCVRCARVSLLRCGR